MDLQLIDSVTVDNLNDLKAICNKNDLILIKNILDEHYFSNEEDADDNMSDFLSFFMEKKYPDKFIYSESTTAYVFSTIEVTEAIKASLEMPQEDLPTAINTKNPITKMIIDWRLKSY